MYCSYCGAYNPENAKNCSHCAATLVSLTTASETIRKLQQELETAQTSIDRLRRYLPSVIADGILHDQKRLRGERRDIAVLFADAVNFTRLSASLDAESVFNLINELLGRLVACVHRYGGLVDKFTGDGLMAIFGAPVANENNAEMAVRAALDMQRAATEFTPIAKARLGAPLEIRIGIHCGPAIAGILGTTEQAAYTVIGDTVNLAARLEALATPGNILVSTQVYTRTRPFFNFQAQDPLTVKGMDQPIVTYEVTGKRLTPEATRGIIGVPPIFLGHDAELAELRAQLRAFLENHQGQCIIVHGEAGMGKSRLVSEWLSDVGPNIAQIWQGRSLPYIQGVGYGVFRSLMQNAIQADPTIAPWNGQISPAMIPFLKQIMGLSLSAKEALPFSTLPPEHIKQLTALAMREWLIATARRQRLIIVFEDFHWADDLSRDLLKSLSALTTEVPLILCVITRTLAQKPFDASIPEAEICSVGVKPLTHEQSRDLLAHIIALEGLSDAIINTILTRAQGNPFYIEEFARMLIEKGMLRLVGNQWHVVSNVTLEKLDVPTSLRELIMARLDRLPENFWNILRDAAVIGLQFDARILGKIEQHFHGIENIMPTLERLTEAGLIEPRAHVDPYTYTFRHILTQESIYESILHTQRPELHRMVAEAITQLYPDNLYDQAEVLARHYDLARIRDKALHYALIAGDKARLHFANRKAAEYYSRALQLSQHLNQRESERWQAAIGLGDVQQHIGEYEEATALYQAALEEWKEAPPEAQAEAMMKLGHVWIQRGNVEEAEKWLQDGLACLEKAAKPQPQIQAESYSALGWIALRRGDLPGAQALLEQALALVDHTAFYDTLSSILNRLGAVYYNRGDWERATQAVERALAIREELGDLLGVARSSNNLGILKCNSGDWKGALASYQRGLEILEMINDIEGIAIAHTNIGNLHINMGEWEKAEANLEQSFNIAQKIANPYEIAQAHLNLSLLYLAQDRFSQVQHHLDAAIMLYKQAGARANPALIDAYWLQGSLCLAQGQIDDAATWAERSHALLQEVQNKADQESAEWGRYEQLLGRIAAAQGHTIQALEHLGRARTIFNTIRNHLEVGRTAYHCAQAWLSQGEREKARTECSEAHRIFTQLGAMADLRRAEQMLKQLNAV